MRKADAICALMFISLGILVCADSMRHGVFGWDLAGPSPGMYPFLLGLGVILGSVIVLGQTFLRSRGAQGDKPFIPPGALKPVLCVGIPSALMILLTQYIGLYLAAGLYLAVYMRWIGRHRWTAVLVVSILLPLAGYLLFEKWFQIPLPEGSLTARLQF